MATLNQCSFIGHLGKDPELTVTPNEKPITKFSLAVDQGKDQQPLWLTIVTWNKLAEIVGQYARKGMLVFVQGRLVLCSYKDKNQTDRVAVDIIATTVQLLDKRQSKDEDISELDAPVPEK